ncbi:M48 family metalloprotease [Shewanella baltica]|uniref:M48 family metallopeptidase n=1 Tax=Shewanella baltica TaxID=62322 RepID=UPI00217E8870|nr:M48 family metallopeptidase [Shewanella baltica]MCS6101633.1 M48 family metalloprotease [Shewanella baltica]MCS6184714.1 M48 family metalloprotease [Shewanella baltica]MCS6233258.1 M48 family metalloprotease [Shewanella baltica]
MEQVITATAGNDNPIQMTEIVYSKEKSLFTLLAIISGIVWAALIIGTLGMALLYVLMFFIIYLFSHSAFISYLKGTAVEINAEQFPELHKQYLACCDRLEMRQPPRAYLLAADGMLNALATRFLGRNYIVLFSSIVDALESDKDALNFYIGHELGHIRRNHIGKAPFLVFATWLPLVGAAYSRACEYTCDLHGLRCCNSLRSATNAVAVLAAGVEQWKRMNVDQYIRQARESSGFWMSLHELNGSYPWLTKRMARVDAKAQGTEYTPPSRSAWAFVFSLFMPRMGTAGGGLIIFAAIIGVAAALALPAYKQYQEKMSAATSYEAPAVTEATPAAMTVPDATLAIASIDQQHQALTPITDILVGYYQTNQAWPTELDALKLTDEQIATFNLYTDGIVGFVGSEALGDYQGYEVYLSPQVDEQSNITWVCSSSDIPDEYLPLDCQG